MTLSNRKLEVSATAEQDLTNILHYSTDSWGQTQADAYVQKLLG